MGIGVEGAGMILDYWIGYFGEGIRLPRSGLVHSQFMSKTTGPERWNQSQCSFNPPVLMISITGFLSFTIFWVLVYETSQVEAGIFLDRRKTNCFQRFRAYVRCRVCPNVLDI